MRTASRGTPGAWRTEPGEQDCVISTKSTSHGFLLGTQELLKGEGRVLKRGKERWKGRKKELRKAGTEEEGYSTGLAFDTAVMFVETALGLWAKTWGGLSSLPFA